MFIQFWLYPNGTKSLGFARYPAGTPSCSRCSATGSQLTAVEVCSHWESGFLFPLAAFKFVVFTTGKNPVHFPHLTHLQGSSTGDKSLLWESEEDTLSLENII